MNDSIDGVHSINQRFQIIRALGRGGFGEVHLARERETGELRAIKVLHDVNPENMLRFQREAVTLARQIDNRHVVDIVEARFDSMPPYLVLEYCEGGSIDQLLGRPQHWRIVADILLHTLVGLRDIHVSGGFHRDIKPHNLLLARDGADGWIVKVADFGFARLPATVGAMTRGPAGTRGYIAPEVLMGEPFHPGADIYSLGIVARELLTGGHERASLERVSAPHELVTLVTRMESRRMNARPTTDEALAVLAALLGGAPGADGSDSASPRPPSPAGGGGAGPSAAGALGAILAGIGVGAAVLAVAAALRGDRKTWDENVRRYRGGNGQFKKG